MGGLVAGNLLAKKGHNVTIFESHITPGGYTSGFWRKGFYFESGTLSFESSDMVFQVMKDIGVYDKIPFTDSMAVGFTTTWIMKPIPPTIIKKHSSSHSLQKKKTWKDTLLR